MGSLFGVVAGRRVRSVAHADDQMVIGTWCAVAAARGGPQAQQEGRSTT
jgi:hypothetical protein